jgi:WD40 repeat protein
VVHAIAFSPDGTLVASGSSGGTIRVWDAKSGIETIPAITSHKSLVLSVAFSPDGSQIVSGWQDTTVRVHGAFTGIEVHLPLRGRGDQVRSVAFSPDGQYVVSVLGDMRIRFWDVVPRTEIIPPGKESFIRSDTFYLDEEFLRIYSPVDATSDHPARKSIDVVQNRWLVDFSDNRTISFLPHMIDVDMCSAAHDRSLAIGTPGGRVFIMHFPPALFESPECRVIEGQGRPIPRRV